MFEFLPGVAAWAGGVDSLGIERPSSRARRNRRGAEPPVDSQAELYGRMLVTPPADELAKRLAGLEPRDVVYVTMLGRKWQVAIEPAIEPAKSPPSATYPSLEQAVRAAEELANGEGLVAVPRHACAAPRQACADPPCQE